MKLSRLLQYLKPAPGTPPRLYLHVGMNKTGTTAIQHTLARNRVVLRRNGLLYPNAGRGRGNAHYLLSHALGFSHQEPRLASDPRELGNLEPRIRAEARKSRCTEVLISSEAFLIGGDVRRVREFFAGWDCRIVIYLRRHDHWLASTYSQGVRTVSPPPWQSGFEGYLELQRRRAAKRDYRRVVERWASVFGAHNLIIRPYERQQNVPDIVTDLLTAIGRADIAGIIDKGPPPLNESLGERELVIIDAIQRAGLDAELRVRLVDRIRQRPGQTKPAGFISPALRRQLIEENLEDYAYIARTYLGRSDGRLFLEPLPDPAAPWSPPEPPTLREIIEAIAGVARD